MSEYVAVPPKTWIAFMGWPLVGKSTTAAVISALTGIQVIDIDDQARTPVLGKPPANDGDDPEIRKQDMLEMGIAYDILFYMARGAIRAGKSIITTCTLSHRVHGQERIVREAKEVGANLYIIWCNPTLSPEVLGARMEDRLLSGYTGATRSVPRVIDLRDRFPAADPDILGSFCTVDTGKHSPEECARQALAFICGYGSPADAVSR